MAGDLRAKLADAWEEFEVSAKPNHFDGETEFFSIESMVDAAYDVKKVADDALAEIERLTAALTAYRAARGGVS